MDDKSQMTMKLLQIFCLILFLISLINPIESTNKKLNQKSFDQIFGEKWEEKEEENLEEKREIIQKYYKIKEKIKEKGRKYSAKEWGKIERKIAKKLGIYRMKIYQWIKELRLNQKIYKCYKSKRDEQKFEIVQKFIAMKSEFKQKRKHSKNEWNQNYKEICKKIGVSQGTINKWKKQFGISCKRMTEEQKMEKMKKYWRIKKEIPKISERKIAKMMKISKNSIQILKKQFGEEMFQRTAE